MSLFESIWADDNSDDLLFENSPCTIEGESSAFDPGHSLEFGSHPSDGCSTKQDHVNHGPIVFDRGCVSFEDQQLAGGSSGADDMSATNNLLQQQHVEQSMSSDSGEYRDRSVLDLKSDILGISTKIFRFWVCLVLTKLFQRLGHIPDRKARGRPIECYDDEGSPDEIDN